MTLDTRGLPAEHVKVLETCLAEAWTNHEASDVHSAVDVATDIIERLSREYDVTCSHDIPAGR